MDANVLIYLINKAKEDPEFFHDLAFNPERAISRIDNEEIKKKVHFLDPGSIINRIVTCYHTLYRQGTHVECVDSCEASRVVIS